MIDGLFIALVQPVRLPDVVVRSDQPEFGLAVHEYQNLADSLDVHSRSEQFLRDKVSSFDSRLEPVELKLQVVGGVLQDKVASELLELHRPDFGHNYTLQLF